MDLVPDIGLNPRMLGFHFGFQIGNIKKVVPVIMEVLIYFGEIVDIKPYRPVLFEVAILPRDFLDLISGDIAHETVVGHIEVVFVTFDPQPRESVDDHPTENRQDDDMKEEIVEIVINEPLDTLVVKIYILVILHHEPSDPAVKFEREVQMDQEAHEHPTAKSVIMGMSMTSIVFIIGIVGMLIESVVAPEGEDVIPKNEQQ